jgi:F-type H+-transporting ATPase subunit a
MRLDLMASEGGEHDSVGLGEYISHHLTHLSSRKQTALFDASVVHWDTIAFSLICAAIVMTILLIAARRATSGVPGRFQGAVEVLIEWANDQAKSMVHGKLDFIAPLALTVFLWVAVMNAVDLFPVDWFPRAAQKFFGLGHLRPLATADLNGTLGMSLGVLLLVLYYNVKVKGVGGWLHELMVAPFGRPKLSANPLTWLGVLVMTIVNFVFNMLEFVSRTVSHGFRLYGNMYAGELIFFLIAGLGATATAAGIAGQLIAGSVWAAFHVLIVLLQAFIFMMLTLVYLGQAHDHH